MPDPTPPTEAQRMREELENLAVAASPTMVWEQAFAVALDALLAAVRREERERCASELDARAYQQEAEASAAHLCGNVAVAIAKQERADANRDSAAALRASQEGENG